MTSPAADGFSLWAEVPWSTIPGRLREQPDQWPVPRRPSDRRVRLWRTGVVALVAFPVVIVGFQLFDRSAGSGPATVLQLVVLWTAVLVTLLFGSVAWLQATQPYVKRSWDLEELARETRLTRREVLRALRRREHISSEMVPVTRFWIDRSRATTRANAWVGLIWSCQLAVSSTQPWWLLAMWFVYVALWLGVVVWFGRREMTFRHWESGSDR